MRLYLAGIESKQSLIEAAQPRYMLFTFAYVQGSDRRKEKILKLVKQPWCKDFLCDSGAFTFFSKKNTTSASGWEQYVDEYAEFVKAGDIKHFFELDIDSLIGLENVEKLRGRLESRTGRQCIPVWHLNRGWKYFEQMCKDYSYVSVGGLVKGPGKADVAKLLPFFVDKAHKYGAELHGLGYTDTKKYSYVHVDSADSTSWCTGSRYGIVFEFQGDHLLQTRPYYQRSNKGKILNGQKYDEAALKIWTQYAKFLDT